MIYSQSCRSKLWNVLWNVKEKIFQKCLSVFVVTMKASEVQWCFRPHRLSLYGQKQLRVSKWWQSAHFWVKYPFKNPSLSQLNRLIIYPLPLPLVLIDVMTTRYTLLLYALTNKRGNTRWPIEQWKRTYAVHVAKERKHAHPCTHSIFEGAFDVLCLGQAISLS